MNATASRAEQPTRFRRGAASRIAAIGVLAALGFVGYRLAFAPIHGVSSSAACDRAYADARTHADSISVDFLTYPDPDRGGDSHLCGMRHARLADTTR